MKTIPLSQLPNQSFSILLDNNQWDFLIKTVGQTTVCSLNLNGTDLIDSAICAAGAFIIQSQYLEAGNFFFVTQNFALPIWTQFTVSQALIYISAAELAALRVPPPYPITAAFFNPIAGLPLRFSPQGYIAS